MDATKNQSFDALTRAVEIAGSQVELARLLGKKQPHIYKWLNSPNGVPPEHCFPIETATGGKVTRRDLRPDDWKRIWPELSGQDEAPKATKPKTLTRPRQKEQE